MKVGQGKTASFWFDFRLRTCNHYLSSIVTVLCVIVILGGSTVAMSYMVHKDVAVPMQRMVQLVTSFAEVRFLSTPLESFANGCVDAS